MKVAITGCAGFIGSNLTRELLKIGYEVNGIDNLSTGYGGNIGACRSIDSGKFRFYESDINDPGLYKLFDGADVVFHLAALPRVSFSIDYPIEANHANVSGVINVLDAARKAGVKRVVFSSSSSIYGGASSFPTAETSEPNPKSPYALHKLTGEHYMRLYSELHGLDTVSLRYFNVIGSHQRLGGAYSTVVPAFLSAAVIDGSGACRIDGSGEQSRDFCPVQNVVQANITAALHPTKLDGEVFNIALGETRTVNEVYEKICALSGRKLLRINAPERKGDPFKSQADISKAQKTLGYKPVVGFEDGLKRTYDWWVNGCKC